MERPLPTVRGTLLSLFALPIHAASVVGALYVKGEWLPGHTAPVLALWLVWCAAVWEVLRRMEPISFRIVGALSPGVAIAILSAGIIQDRAAPGDMGTIRILVAGLAGGIGFGAMQWALARSDTKRYAGTGGPGRCPSP